MDIERVQRWIMSSLLLTVLFLFGGGMAMLGQTMPDRGGSRLGLAIVAAVVGLIAILGVRLINQRSVVTFWVVFAAVPALLGWWLGQLVR